MYSARGHAVDAVGRVGRRVGVGVLHGEQVPVSIVREIGLPVQRINDLEEFIQLVVLILRCLTDRRLQTDEPARQIQSPANGVCGGSVIWIKSPLR